MLYSAESFDDFNLWANDAGGIYVLKRGTDKYDVTMYTIRNGAWEPTSTAAHRNALWVLNLIRHCKMTHLDGTINFIKRKA